MPPQTVPAKPAARQRGSTARRGGDLALIVVDDMDLSRSVVKPTLSRNGFTDVRMAETAAHVLEMLGERSADVVLARANMPATSGLELTHAIRARDEQARHYTAVILLAEPQEEAAMLAALRSGVDDYLAKPIAEQALAARVIAAGRTASLQNSLLETSDALSAANEHLNAINTTDVLTGLGNRRHLMQQLESFLLQITTRGGAVCLGVLDIDGFAALNDTHGHEAGDEILTGAGRRLRRTVRPTDALARIEGDELAIALYYHDPDALRPSVFARILNAIAQRPMQTSEGDIPVTACIGAHCFTSRGEIGTAASLMESASENLRYAKRQGRNRVITS